MSEVEVKNGWVYVRGVKVCRRRVTANGEVKVAFLDRCQGRAERRGTNQTETTPERLYRALKDGK